MKPIRRSGSKGRRVHRPSTPRATRLLLNRLEDRVAPAVLTIRPAAIAPVEGQPFNGTVATFTDTDATATASHFTATINWGDGTTSAGTVAADPTVTGQFDIQGTHTYTDEGHPNVIVTVTDTVAGGSATTGSYSQSNLVTDNPTVLAGLGFAPAAHTDTHLKNPWGIAFPATGPFWISDNGTGVSTLYDGAGNPQTLVVTIPVSANPGATSPAPVTGVVFNGSTDFNVAGANTPARFIFATEDGTIAAWNSGTTAVLKVNNANFTTGPVYKGLAIGNNGTGNFIYATNFRQGTIDVFDTNFAKVTLGTGGFGTFADPAIPAGFAPFGIENTGGKLFVTYAKQDPDKKDDVAGAGNGFVDTYDPSGHFLQRFASQGPLNSPWGLALAPVTFGTFAGDLLVGNFGNGLINAFNPSTGALVGQLSDGHNRPISIDGLWALKFGNNGTAGGAGTLFFTAGINDEADGLFGRLSADVNPVTIADAPLLPGAGVSTGVTAFSGVGGNNTSTTAGTANAALAAFEAAVGGANNGGTATPQAGGFRIINWDGVKLDGTDFGGQTTVIDPGHVVGIPVNRFQERGVQFEVVYAVGGPASATDTSTFSTVNPSVSNLFPAFSPANTFAMFNDNGIDFSFVLPSVHATAPVPAASRGFGAIFRNVRLANTTSIEYFNGNNSLGKFFVPVGTAGQAEFLGELFNSPVVTRVSITLGTDVLFSFDGVHFSAGGIDDPATGHNLAVTDDFAYAEPVPLGGGQPTVTATAGVPLTNVQVAAFTDTNPNANASDFTGTIDWGDGHTSPATFTLKLPPSASPFFAVSGSNTYATGGTFPVHVEVQDLGGSSIALDTTATVQGATPPPPPKVHYFAVGAPVGAAPEVKVYDAATGAIRFDFLAYSSDFLGGVRVAAGDVNGDGIDDIVTGAGRGGGPHVKVFNGADGSLLFGFFAYDARFAGGVFVAAGDVNGDGKADIITGAGAGGGPHVKAFSGTDLSLLASFFAYDLRFTGGVTVAAGDVNGDGKADIVTGAGAGGGPHVRAFSGTDLSVLASFFAYDLRFAGGVFVAAGDVNGDGKADIITGAGPGLDPRVNVYSGADLSRLNSFDAYDSSFIGGVRVAAADVNGDGKADIITGAGPAGGPQVKAFDGTSLALLDSFFAFDPSFRGGIYVG